jgi:prolyl oligopeptidase
MIRTAIVALLCAATVAVVTVAAPPISPKKPVTDTYHGVSVADEYRWLEAWTDKTVQKWSEAQNTHARSVLDKLPGVETLRERLTKIMAAKTTSHGSLAVRGSKVFAMRRQPPKQQPFLVVMPAADKPEAARVLLDPNELDKKGTTSIDWFVPSPDGKLVAVSISKAGSEAGDVSVFDTETGKQTDVVIPRVNNGTAGGDLAWAPDGKGFYYTRYPRGDERPPADRDFFQQLYFHELGTPTEKDRYELGKDLPRIAEIKMEVHEPTGRVLCTVQNGDGGEFAHFVRGEDGKWKQFAGFKDQAIQAAFGSKDSLFVVSRKEAPRGKILRLAAGNPDLAKAEVVVPEGTDAIVTDFWTAPDETTVLPTESRLYVTYQLGGPSVIRCFDYTGKEQPAPKQPEVGAVGAPTPTGGDDVIFAAGSFTEPTALYRFSPASKETAKLPLTSPPVVDLSDVQVVREFATSKDGTKVPVNIMIPKGAKLDGSNPCLVTGYGGYGISIEPSFAPTRRVLFDHGFVVAVVNLRGGGEFGEEWHKAGSLTKKQNVFDDFAAALKHMIDRTYTSAEKLAIQGGSNGGLLMGATLTQHPDLVKCVITHVGIYDMLRVELSPNGAFNIPEFGTVKDAEQFKSLHAYSPYHNVKDGTKYPAVLFLTGANDPRVDPMQSRKMTARLQAAYPEGTVLLRTSASSGHGQGTALSERIEESTDVFAFLFEQLGVKVKPRGERPELDPEGVTENSQGFQPLVGVEQITAAPKGPPALKGGPLGAKSLWCRMSRGFVRFARVTPGYSR